MAVSMATGLMQFMVPLTEQFTEGLAVSAATTVEEVNVQPLLCVTVTEKAPAIEVDVIAVVAPLLHK